MNSIHVALAVVILLSSSTLLSHAKSARNDDVAGPIVKLSDLQTKTEQPKNSTKAKSGGKPETIAQILDAALQKEFTKETSEDGKGGSNFNATVQHEEAVLETVVRITGKATAAQHDDEQHDTDAKRAGGDVAGKDAAGKTDGAGASDGGDTAVGSGTASNTTEAAEVPVTVTTGVDVESDVDRIIDSQDNEFVLSKPNESVASLTLDQQLIRDISVLLVAAMLFGSLFEAVRQPVINGYLIGGAVVGPGGLNIVKELVQVESLAQLGVQLLLFGLGLELSFTKLRAVWGVAVMGGTLQVVLLSLICGLVAAAAGAPLGQGLFVGALLSMSSTAVVVKCLEVMRTGASAYGQITVGTLLLQDCMVGLMFALLPVFNGDMGSAAPSAGLAAEQAASEAKGRVVVAVLTTSFKLTLAVAAALAIAKTLLSPALRIMQRQASRELIQLGLVSFCCGIASFSQSMGLSAELGAFVAGVMVATALGPGPAAAAAGVSPGLSSVSGAGSGSSGGGAASSLGMGSLAPMAGIGPPPKESKSLGGSGGGGIVGIGIVGGGGLTHVSSPVVGSTEDMLLVDRPVPELRVVTIKEKSSDEWSAEREWEREREREREAQADREWERERLRQSREVVGSHAAYYSIESARNVLVALFMASIGLIMSPRFLADHLGVLTMGVCLVVLVKGALVAVVVRGFSVGLRTSLAVGLSMAHVGEFAFVLLSHAVQSGLLPLQVYMLLLGVTALSLLTTPFIVLLAMHWVLPKEAAVGQQAAAGVGLHGPGGHGPGRRTAPLNR